MKSKTIDIDLNVDTPEKVPALLNEIADQFEAYTPGPWHIGMKPGPIIYGPQGEQVANMLPCMLEREEHNANVRLIASAPALLEALQSFVRATNTTEDSTLALLNREARLAIAQATGGEK